MQRTMAGAIGRLGADVRGATAMEYALLMALIAVAGIGAFTMLGVASAGVWSRMLALFQAAVQ